MKKLRAHWKWVALVCALLPLVVLAVFITVIWIGLPSVDSLHSRAQTISTKILDRNGRLLYEINDPRLGHHTPIKLEAIPLHLRQATVAVEDAGFYSNQGVDLAGVLRALWINLQGGEVLAGGSTITQQLARITLLEPDERAERSILRKVRESLLAWQIAQRYSKDEVLDLYLNEIYYGNIAYGADAASRAYFGKSVTELDLAECALLAGLPQSPVAYDPFNDPDAAKKRQLVVLDLMVKTGVLSTEESAVAGQSRLIYAPQRFTIHAPHFVAFVRSWLEDHFGTETLTRGGLIVTTTLDLALNNAGEAIMRERLAQLQNPDANSPAHNAKNAALVAIRPTSGEIIAMVGSPDYFDASISGAVNATMSLRQPGSAIKPITYAAAFGHVQGFTAATPIFDVRTAFPTREGLPYVPENYDAEHHGPISVREALATSNNIAAVRVLQSVGLDSMLGLANMMGIHSFRSADDYGLALTLGGGEVRLLELTTAFGVFANSGYSLSPIAVLEVVNSQGATMYTINHTEIPTSVVDPRVAWLITDILSDNDARAGAFGESSVLRLDRPAAVKTGTTTDWRDNWTVGYTPDLVTGVWVGNADNEPMVRISGVSGAGPIWHDFMEVAHQGVAASAFTQPDGLKRFNICILSGMLPTPECAYSRSEWFISGTEPTVADTWYVKQKIDTATGKVADSDTPAERIVERVALRLPSELHDWAQEHGWPLYSEPPLQAGSCAQGSSCAPITMTQPDHGSIYRISKQLPRQTQRAQLTAQVNDSGSAYAEIVLDGTKVIAHFQTTVYDGFWTLIPGDHSFVARLFYPDGHFVESVPVTIRVEE